MRIHIQLDEDNTGLIEAPEFSRFIQVRIDVHAQVYVHRCTCMGARA